MNTTPRLSSIVRTSVLGVAGALCSLAASAQTIHLVATYPGGSNSAVYAVNSNGTAAGGYVTGSIASGATTPSLTISNFQPGDTGQYCCKVNGDCGFAFSSVVNLTHCPPDYNCDGLTNVSDIFDLLTGWFAGNPAANFNGIGDIDVSDIFAFLAAWFAGC